VQVLSQSTDKKDKELLIKEFFSSKNFHKGQSLFIRREILRAFSLEDLKNNPQFVKSLYQDQDDQIRHYVKLRFEDPVKD
jgi:hypothetical protein